MSCFFLGSPRCTKFRASLELLQQWTATASCAQLETRAPGSFSRCPYSISAASCPCHRGGLIPRSYPTPSCRLLRLDTQGQTWQREAPSLPGSASVLGRPCILGPWGGAFSAFLPSFPGQPNSVLHLWFILGAGLSRTPLCSLASAWSHYGIQSPGCIPALRWGQRVFLLLFC